MYICWLVMCRLSHKVQDSYCSVQNVQDKQAFVQRWANVLNILYTEVRILLLSDKRHMTSQQIYISRRKEMLERLGQKEPTKRYPPKGINQNILNNIGVQYVTTKWWPRKDNHQKVPTETYPPNWTHRNLPTKMYSPKYTYQNVPTKMYLKVFL